LTFSNCYGLFHVYPNGSKRPLQFASETLITTQRKYSQIDTAHAIVYSVKKCYQYLYGSRFALLTDHFPLLKKGLPILSATRMQHYGLTHPATNGLAEKSVQSFKNALKDLRMNNNDQNKDLQTFLFNYRITLHTVTAAS
ncbi:hypothetical protein ILUMI_08900, partial [Ignelater luminosus]